MKKIYLPLLSVILGLMMTACNAVWQDEPVCNQGLSIRFIYSYNMEYANAFPSQVHCLTVLIYDEEGNYIRTVEEHDRALLSDENWRMPVDLPEGRYRVVAYGGMACDDASFHFSPIPAPGGLYDRRDVELDADCLTDPARRNLHPLFFGEAEITEVGYNDADYVPVTVSMMKDTNNLRILMHNSDNSPLDSSDFRFTLTDDNTLFSYDNSLLPSPTVTYLPWSQGDNSSLTTAEDDQAPYMLWSEIATSRFIVNSRARLTIEQISTGRTVLSIPIVNYLLQYRSDNYSMIPPQEFLDRKSEWELSLFLDSGDWTTVTISIRDWTVRINNIIM
ncbi:MAG: FimB/Mfa2 family fimbrial subunit [Bacteroides sp.]|nr:FimB/Mfa2 family fimbrial subunit [Bacteroides sp.]